MITDAYAIEPYPLAPGVLLRPLAAEDAGDLALAYVRNRDHLWPWEPRRDEAFFTEEGQAARLRDLLAMRHAGRVSPWVVTDRQDGIVGVVNLNNIVQGAWHSCNLGYWIAAGHAGRGLATAAVTAVCRAADERLGLHRIEAGTVTANAASQRVLAKCGFELIGTARKYLHIDGEWRDHVLFQRILNDRRPTA
ncbi:GNAT family N-acetyltransferase [Streptomyces morookaense]|uniref:GNAT family N-acetyltransferase n=1 Tax=Streptomyces morookaense TaxID=1970 RepID=A0A7Y7B1R9_STRMO|nr:GNAT family N-acetyltransferase [Streptomyces morookaense]NVK77392.1 GNAT family N-acetyltransferase [Streptomyces morookaense]GHF21469.1 ribosomal protein S5 alanine N-acetyltransferase [Streptomyces morookaense]